MRIGTGEYYNEDCLEGMKRYPDKYFDLAIVDPPYGIEMDGANNEIAIKSEKWKNARKTRNYKNKDWDKAEPGIEYFCELLRVSKNQIIWGGNHFTDKLHQNKHWIVWDKKTDFTFFSGLELAWTSFPLKGLAIFRYLWGGYYKEKMIEVDNRVHPTQKPLALYKFLLNKYAKTGDKILDTHVGSASSLIACCDMGFEFVGFELDKDYYGASVKRINDFLAQGKLF